LDGSVYFRDLEWGGPGVVLLVLPRFVQGELGPNLAHLMSPAKWNESAAVEAWVFSELTVPELKQLSAIARRLETALVDGSCRLHTDDVMHANHVLSVHNLINVIESQAAMMVEQ
jgi:hypothetical protein